MDLNQEILTLVREKGHIRNIWGSICENILIKAQRELENVGYLKDGKLTEEGIKFLEDNK